MWTRALLAVTALLAGVSAVFLAADLFTARPLPHGFRTPTLALEFTRDASDVERIVGPADRPQPDGTARPSATDNPDRRLMRAQLAMDRVLIGVYALFFTVAGVVVTKRPALGWRGHAGWLAIAAGLLAAYFDVKEDAAMTAVLDAQPAGEMPAHFAVLKFVFFFLAAIAIAPVAADRRWLGKAIAILFAAGGLAGIAMVLAFTYPARLDVPVAVLSTGVLLLLIALLRESAHITSA
jgi:hypothetical protein